MASGLALLLVYQQTVTYGDRYEEYWEAKKNLGISVIPSANANKKCDILKCDENGKRWNECPLSRTGMTGILALTPMKNWIF